MVGTTIGSYRIEAPAATRGDQALGNLTTKAKVDCRLKAARRDDFDRCR